MATAEQTIVLTGGDLGGTEVTSTLTSWPLGETQIQNGNLSYRRDSENLAVFTGMAEGV